MTFALRAMRGLARPSTTRRERLAQQAREELVEAFEKANVAADDKRGWGQVLDWAGAQYGIYGTSAGVQVLAGSYGADNGLVEDGLALLAELDDPTSPFCKKQDHLNTYKLIHCADAAAPCDPVIEDENPAMRRLIAAALPSGGWGDYVAHDGLPTPNASVLATASALYTLRRYKPFRGSPECSRAVGWLSASVGTDRWSRADLRAPTQAALSLLALQPYVGSDAVTAIDDFGDRIRFIRRGLTRWIRRRPKPYLCEQYRHDFVEAGPYKVASDYIAYMPDCVSALAFLEAPKALTTKRRRHVHRVVHKISHEVRDSRFHPRNVGTRSSLDHLWAYRVLGQFTDGSALTAMRGLRGRILLSSTIGFVALLTLLSGIAIVLWRMTDETTGWHSASLYVASGVLASVVAGLFVLRASERQ